MKQFKKFIEIYGEGEKHQEIDLKLIEKYKDNFIPEIYELLEQDGISSYMNGFIWTLDPSEYIDWLNEWLQMDAICIPFARTALGDIFFVTNKQVMIFSTSKGLLDYTTNRVDWFFNRYLTDTVYLDKYFNKHLYDLLEDKMTLKSNECFGFVPLLSLGGEEKVENLKKVNLKEHFNLLMQSSMEVSFFKH